jgi:hypothetical protein
MPLVTITCSEGFYPVDRNPISGSTGVMPSTGEEGVIDLAQVLPRLIAESATALGLDPDNTPEGGVQVDIKKFHGYAVNTVDLWICVQFTEPYPGKDVAIAAREAFIDMLAEQLRNRLARHQIAFSCAIDMFWGPGHGCIVPSSPDRDEIHW